MIVGEWDGSEKNIVLEYDMTSLDLIKGPVKWTAELIVAVCPLRSYQSGSS